MEEFFTKVEIQSGNSGPNGLIIAGIHGDEYEPIMATIQLQNELKDKLKSGMITLVPVVNESAFFSMSRTGSDGLDLARACPGRAEGSPTEKVASKISAMIQKADFLIDMHTGGNAFNISPLSGYMLHSEEPILEVQRQMAKAFNLPLIWGTSQELEGRTLSVARDALKPAIYTEFGGGGYDPSKVTELVTGCMNVLSYFGMLELKSLDQNKVKVVIEDHRKASGHLQVMYPSQHRGIFSPKVKLGDQVCKGDILGKVFSFYGSQLQEIFAEEDGLVFLIRAVPPVVKGDALAGILPVTNEDFVILR